MPHPRTRGPLRAQGAFEYILLLGLVIVLIVFAISILKTTGIGGIGWEINKTLQGAGPFLNSSNTSGMPLVTIVPHAATPPPTPTPTPGVTPLPPVQFLSSCATLTFPGNYRLSADVSATSACFSIVAQDVVLDCAGHEIRGSGSPGSSGIYSVSSSNVVAKNCVIRNFSSGVYFDSCSFCGAENVTATGSGKGVWLKNSPNSRAVRVTASSDSVGVFFEHSNYFNATGNRAEGNADGMRVESSSGGYFASNTASNNSGYGLYFYASSRNRITANSVFGNGEGVRFASYSNDNTISFNNASFNAGRGFFFAPSTGNNLTKNAACSNAEDLYCIQPQVDGGNNTCGPVVGMECSGSVWCKPC